MSDKPSNGEEEEDAAAKPKMETTKTRIVIIEERDIPFEEERPPNFSLYYQIKVHRVRRHEDPREVDE